MKRTGSGLTQQVSTATARTSVQPQAAAALPQNRDTLLTFGTFGRLLADNVGILRRDHVCPACESVPWQKSDLDLDVYMSMFAVASVSYIRNDG